MAVNFLQALLLSVIQGITEWIPISSSGHLAIIQNLFGFQDLSFDVFLHLASLLAVIIIFRKDILKVLNLTKRESLVYLLLIILATVPAGVVGYLFRDQIAELFENMLHIGIFFILSGAMIYATKFAKEKKENISWFNSLIIGIFQAISILPSVSRSGATISSGLFMGIKKEQVVKFSFLLSIPAILGAGIFESKKIILSDINFLTLATSFIVTFIVSIVAIKLLLKIIKTDRFYLFGWYNMLLGIIVVLMEIF
jgi:undecaprenyl-diphosphatase